MRMTCCASGGVAAVASQTVARKAASAKRYGGTDERFNWAPPKETVADAVEEPGRVPVKSIENDMTAMEPFMVSFSNVPEKLTSAGLH